MSVWRQSIVGFVKGAAIGLAILALAASALVIVEWSKLQTRLSSPQTTSAKIDLISHEARNVWRALAEQKEWQEAANRPDATLEVLRPRRDEFDNQLSRQGGARIPSLIPMLPPSSPRTEERLRAIDQRLQATVRPARVEFGLAPKMAMGSTYAVNLEIVREGASPRFPAQDKIAAEVLDKARASIDSVDLKIERLGDEWQEIPAGGRGLWLWKVEPLRPGATQLVLSIHHAAVFDGIEKRFLVDFFPRSVEVDASWWYRVQMALLGAPAFVSGTAGVVTSLVTIFGIATPALLWWRKRRGREAA